MKYIVSLAGREIEVEVEGERVAIAGRAYLATLSDGPGAPVRQLLVDGRPLELGVESSGRGQWGITVQGDRWDAEVLDERTRHIRGLAGGSEQQRGPGTLRAPMPGLVVRIQVEPGQTVAAGAGVVVLEAMKMENELKAAAPGRVKVVRVKPGDAVEKGEALVEFETHP